MAAGKIQALIEDAASAQREGRLSDAENLLTAALNEGPQTFKAAVSLAFVRRLQGDMPGGAEASRLATQIRPKALEGHLQLGLCLLAQGNFSEAADALGEAIRIKPDLAPLHHHLGLCYENLGDLKNAADSFRTAMRLAPQDVRSRVSLGSLLLAGKMLDGAKECAQASVRLDPTSSDAHVLMAKVLSAQKNEREAERYMRKAVELGTTNAFAHSVLGFRLLQKGEFEESEQSFTRSLELEPSQGISYFGITQGRKITAADAPMILQMERVFEQAHLSNDERSYLAHGLAKSYDNLGDCARAMEHYHLAHRFSFFVKGGAGFDRVAYSESVDATIELYSSQRVAALAGQGFSSAQPIFIVGMMRSGTTLTEQIISSHSQVGAAGEQTFWNSRSHLAEDRQAMEFNLTQASSLAREYCREMARLVPGHARITDKLPGNYRHLGLLHLALPNAKIIHTRRNPIDTCLSIFVTPNPNAPTFAHSQEDIAFVYREYLRLMSHWRSVLPPESVLEVVYEDLVERPEVVIREMIDFCGFEWESECLSHENNSKSVNTPSLWQVRQPIYKSSAGKWKRYEPWLNGFDSLRDLIEAEPAI